MAQTTCTGLALADRIEEAVQRMKHQPPVKTIEHRELKDNYITNIAPKISELLSSPRDPLKAYQEMDILTLAKHVISQMYFGGQLAAKVSVTWATIPGNTRGWTQWMTVVDKDQREITIEIDPAKHESEWAFTATLIHEMSHAYVGMHICYCGSRQCDLHQNDLCNAGATGHGWYWQRLAMEAEKLTSRVWGKSIDLNREYSAVYEIREVKDRRDCFVYLQNAFGDVRGRTLFEELDAKRLRETKGVE